MTDWFVYLKRQMEKKKKLSHSYVKESKHLCSTRNINKQKDQISMLQIYLRGGIAAVLHHLSYKQVYKQHNDSTSEI